MVSSNGSPKIVIASVKATPCFFRLALAFSGSHSNSIDSIYLPLLFGLDVRLQPRASAT